MAKENPVTDNVRADLVAKQYLKWEYPEPIQNIESWLRNSWQWFDPSHAHRSLWPDRPYKPDMDILVAGCGTNQAAVLAYTNRGAKVTGVDVSPTSLEHQKFLKDKYSLKNLDVHLLPIEEVSTLGKDYDLIVSTGVLHHMADPDVGMKSLADVLRPDGVAAIMLYARYGRIGVELMQAVFRELGMEQDEESLRMVRQAISGLPSTHPVRGYIAVAPDLDFDAGLVDTFLHGRDRSYTTDGCVDLVEGAGLVFQDWFLRSSYYPPMLTDPNEFNTSVSQLEQCKMWALMERLNTNNGCHFFMACKPERPVESYRVDFSSSQALDYVPMFRLNCGVSGGRVNRPSWSVQLNPTHLAIAQHIDGERNIAQIAQRAVESGALVAADQAECEYIALDLFESLWRFDFVAMDLSRN